MPVPTQPGLLSRLKYVVRPTFITVLQPFMPSNSTSMTSALPPHSILGWIMRERFLILRPVRPFNGGG